MVDTLEKIHPINEKKTVEVFVFIDNSVDERAYFKGYSLSKKLIEFVLRMKMIGIYSEIKFISFMWLIRE